MLHARHTLTATLVGALTLAGCSGEEPIGSPTAPAAAGTPITVELPVDTTPTITWEVVVDGVEPSPMRSPELAVVKQALSQYPDLTCWIFTATITQIDGPPEGSELRWLSEVPHMRANLANGDETSVHDDVCLNAASANENHTWVLNVETAPGPGNSIQVYYEAATETPEPPASVRIEAAWTPQERTYSYVSIPSATK